MRLERVDPASPKGWLAGGWDSSLPVSVGFATEAIDDAHVHAEVTEVFLVAKGRAKARVRSADVELVAGDVLILEPGEAHTFLHASDDYLHFVVHAPALTAEHARAERSSVPRTDLGL